MSFCIHARDIPWVIIDSLSGKAEVQRAGQKSWVLVNKKTKLFNNDNIRVHSQSHAKLKWQNGSVIFVNSNSQLLVNLFQDTINNKLTHYITVFFGAAFFVIKKTLPRSFTNRDNIKIYTPTAILSIRGTSFLVKVKKESGHTQIGVLNGVVLVKNILQTNSLFLSAGYKAEIGINTDPLVPIPLLQKDIESLKTWVPSLFIENEMNTQTSESRNDYRTLMGKLEDKIIIIPFSNSSTYKGRWDISTIIAKSLADVLKRSNQYNCLTLQKASNEDDMVTIGIENNARFVITGDIVRFEIVQKAEINASVNRYREFSTATICIALQFIDAQNKKLLYTGTLCGEISDKNTDKNRWPYIRKLTFNVMDKEFSASILGKAMHQILEQSTVMISQYFGSSNGK